MNNKDIYIYTYKYIKKTFKTYIYSFVKCYNKREEYRHNNITFYLIFSVSAWFDIIDINGHHTVMAVDFNIVKMCT